MVTVRTYDDWDHYRDSRKHDWRPGDRLPLDQRLAVAKLVGICEGLVGSGALGGGEAELQVRQAIAETLVAFDMPSKSEREPA